MCYIISLIISLFSSVELCVNFMSIKSVSVKTIAVFKNYIVWVAWIE